MMEQNSKGRGPERLIEEINRTSTAEGMAAVWFLGQESVVFKGGRLSSISTLICPMIWNAKRDSSAHFLHR